MPVLAAPMAVFVAPVAAAGVGGAYVVALSKTYSHTANLSAKQLFGDSSTQHVYIGMKGRTPKRF